MKTKSKPKYKIGDTLLSNKYMETFIVTNIVSSSNFKYIYIDEYDNTYIEDELNLIAGQD